MTEANFDFESMNLTSDENDLFKLSKFAGIKWSKQVFKLVF